MRLTWPGTIIPAPFGGFSVPGSCGDSVVEKVNDEKGLLGLTSQMSWGLTNCKFPSAGLLCPD
jgi:hypothetical protein